MNSKKTVSMFFSIAFIGAFAQAVWATPSQQNALVFHGQLVNAGCDANVLQTSGRHDEQTSLRVNAHLTVALVNHDDACSEKAMPISTAYVQQTAVVSGTQNGIVTLTYQ